VSKHDEELRQRILRGDDPQSVRTWFIERVAEGKIREVDFTDFESLFWADIVADYRKWRASRKLN